MPSVSCDGDSLSIGSRFSCGLAAAGSECGKERLSLEGIVEVQGAVRLSPLRSGTSSQKMESVQAQIYWA